MRVLIVPRGWCSCSATSAYVNSEKNAASIARRFVVREDLQRSTKRLALLLKRSEILRIDHVRRRQRLAGVRRDALLPLLESQPVDGARVRLVHDPAKHGAARFLVAGRATPDVVEDVERDFFGDGAVGSDPHAQREDEAMRSFIQRQQRALIASGDGLDENDPVRF